tara:strand:+ start:3089 stop:4084 length:996 start_codon:yes stop_codon:yes gene_type:complete
MITNSELTFGGLFTGVGGIELGFCQSGYKNLWANEIDKYASETYRLNFPNHLIEGDIYSLKGSELLPVDVLGAGFPCQPFSVAGYRKGFKDDRGNLFFEIIRIIHELQEKPKVLFFENVKNFYRHDKGNTYKKVSEEIKKMGYSVFTEILNTAEYTDIPHNRERTFLICFKDELDWENCSQPTVSKKFSELFPPQKEVFTNHISHYYESQHVNNKYYYGEEKYMYEDLEKSMTSKDTIYQWRRIYVRENQKSQCPTLTANMGTGGHNVPLILVDDGIRKLTPRECFNFQGYPQNFKLPDSVPDSQLYKQAGNSVSVPLIKKLADIIQEAYF